MSQFDRGQEPGKVWLNLQKSEKEQERITKLLNERREVNKQANLKVFGIISSGEQKACDRIEVILKVVNSSRVLYTLVPNT